VVDGRLEGVDEETGKVVWVEKKPEQATTGPRKAGRPRGRPAHAEPGSKMHTVLDGNGKQQLVPKGTDPSTLPYAVWPFNPVTANHVCNLITEGKTISQIGLMPGFPPKNTILHWARKYPEFREELKVAREMRAEHFHDEIIKLTDEVKENTAKSARVKFDALKWAAGVNDPNVYGPQTKITGDPNAPLQILVSTGVPAPEKPAPIDAPSEVSE
jgi:hypothetical protein